MCLRGATLVFTMPGLIDRKTKPSFLYCTAYFATAMLRAAFEIEYGAYNGMPEVSVASRSPSPEASVITFLSAPARSRGRKTLIVWTTAMTLTRN